MTEVFRKLIISRLSVQNDCHSPDGEILFVAPIRSKSRTRPWHFLDAHFQKRNKLGWVQERPNFTLDEFLWQLPLVTLDDGARSNFISFQLELLRSTARLNIDDAVGVDFLARGIPPEPVLVVHKVILYGDHRLR